MRRIDVVHRGANDTAGWLIDPAMIGIFEAQRRVLDRWEPGTRVFELPTGQWLVLFGNEEHLDAAFAQGSPVIAVASGFSGAPDLRPETNEFVWWSAGEEHRSLLSSLPEIDPAGWVDIGTPIAVLDALPSPGASTVAEHAVALPGVDLRKAARVAATSDEALRFAAGLAHDTAKWRKRQRRTSGRQGAAGGRSRVGPQRTSKRRPGRDRAARFALRSPLRREIGRRHQQYLNRLTEQFSSGRFDEALRNALPLNGLGGGSGMTLRLPKARTDLQLTGGSTGGRALPLGGTVHQHLNQLYRDAAEKLEAEGKIDEAAFVLSELLNNPEACVALLERHRRYATAAALAEQRKLSSHLIIRLWWQAGDRERAMLLARQTQSYAGVVAHLEKIDSEAAHTFRLHWVDHLERSGDLTAALAAGWPDPAIRPLLANLIERAIALDDDWSLGFHPHRLAVAPSTEHRTAFLEALERASANPAALRFLAEALSNIDSIDPVIDREVCSATVRCLLSTPRQSKDAPFVRSIKAIAKRADPVLDADMPTLKKRSSSTAEVLVPGLPIGTLAPYDVAPLASGRILVALGELGVRLVRTDGRVIAEWPTPCHHLVPADHGNTVILLTDRHPIIEIHVLDLTTRRVRHYGTKRSNLWARSFDGTNWASVDQRGIAFFDMLADRPTVSWRELEPAWTCHALERAEGSIAAVVSAPPGTLYPEQRVMLWRWSTPSMRLQQRHQFETVDRASRIRLLADATSVWERPDEDHVVLGKRGAPLTQSFSSDCDVRASGRFLGIRNAVGTVQVRESVDGATVLQWPGVEPDWDMRVQRQRIAMWTASGQIAVVDHAEREIAAAFSLR